MTTMTDFAQAREEMVEWQLRRRGIDDERLLDAFRSVPRDEFVPEKWREHSYEDGPLPIEAGQTISQPYIVALMIQAAGVKPGDKALEVGAGSGYAAAVMAQVAGRVVAIERHSELARLAAERIRRLGYGNVRIVEGDGTRGCAEEAPFDAILAAASGSHVPRHLVDQLASGGRLVMPLGSPADVQKLVRVVKRQDGSTREDDLGAVRFVPLIGEEGWENG